MVLFGRNNDFPSSKDSGEIEKLTKMVTDLTEKVTGMTQFAQQLATSQQQTNQVLSQFDRELGGLRGGSQVGRDMTELNLDALEKQKTAPLKSIYDTPEDEFEAIPKMKQMQMLEDQILTKVEDALNKTLTPFTKQLENTQSVVAKSQTQSELDKLRSESGPDGKVLREDLNDWLPSMAELRKDPAYKNLPLKALYVVAKDANPELAAKIADKYKPEEKMRDDSYGGLLSSISPKSTETGDLSVEEASLQAAKEFISENGQSPFNVDEMQELELSNQDAFAS